MKRRPARAPPKKTPRLVTRAEADDVHAAGKHGIIQDAMGSEGFNFCQFHLRATPPVIGDIGHGAGRDGGGASAPRRRAIRVRVRSEYSPTSRDPIDDPLVAAGKTWPVFAEGDGAHPPNDRGGPVDAMRPGEYMLSLDALEGRGTMAESTGQAPGGGSGRRHEATAGAGCRAATPASRHTAGHSGGATSMPVFATAGTISVCTGNPDALGPAPSQRVGGQHGGGSPCCLRMLMASARAAGMAIIRHTAMNLLIQLRPITSRGSSRTEAGCDPDHIEAVVRRAAWRVQAFPRFVLGVGTFAASLSHHDSG
jgi:hypothetical protein